MKTNAIAFTTRWQLQSGVDGNIIVFACQWDSIVGGRCLIPFGGSKIKRLQDLKNDIPAIQRLFDETELYQTMDIDFREHMCSEAGMIQWMEKNENMQ